MGSALLRSEAFRLNTGKIASEILGGAILCEVLLEILHRPLREEFQLFLLHTFYFLNLPGEQIPHWAK